MCLEGDVYQNSATFYMVFLLQTLMFLNLAKKYIQELAGQLPNKDSMYPPTKRFIMNFYKSVIEHRGKLLVRGIHGKDYKEKLDFGLYFICLNTTRN